MPTRAVQMLINLASIYRKSVLFALISTLFSGCSAHNNYFPKSNIDITSNPFVTAKASYKTDEGEYPAEYSTLLVKENRQIDDSRMISLPVIKINSLSKSPKEPVFLFNGGPGSSNLRWTIPDYLLQQHDVVLVGYRGADGSSVLNCHEVEAALTEHKAVLSSQSLKHIGEAWRNCASRLQQSGVDLNGYTMIDVIDDIEQVRQELGYQRINILGLSYGTRLAYLYGVKYEKSINRTVMIGATPPGTFGWEPELVDLQLAKHSELWRKSSVLNHAEQTDLTEIIRTVNQDMPDSWLFFDISPDKVRLAAFFSLYLREGAANVFDAYINAYHGDYAGLALMTLAYDVALPNSVIWGDFVSKVASSDYQSSRNYEKQMSIGSSIMGSPFGKLAYGSLQHGDWPIKKIAQKYRQTQTSNVHTLVISGNVDFSTPAENANTALLPYLTHGKHIILTDIGHIRDVFNYHPETVQQLLTQYYDNGNIDDIKFNHVPMEFDAGFSWSEMMKTFISTIAVALVLLI